MFVEKLHPAEFGITECCRQTCTMSCDVSAHIHKKLLALSFQVRYHVDILVDDGALRRIGIEPSFRHHAGITRRNRTRHRLTRS